MDWAYDGTDPGQQVDKKGDKALIYSSWPEFYMPMCRKCHIRRDRGAAAEELSEFREWKSRTGLTLADIAVVKFLK